jgi:hypothetical protein
LSEKGLRPLTASFDPLPPVRAPPAPNGGQRGAVCALSLAIAAGGGLSGPGGRSRTRMPPVWWGRSPEFEGLRVWGKDSYIKTNFLPGLLLHAGASAGRRGGSSRWRPPKSSTWMRHVGLPPSLGNMGGWAMLQKLNSGGCHLLPPAPAWRGTRGHGMHPNRPACSCPRGSGLL